MKELTQLELRAANAVNEHIRQIHGFLRKRGIRNQIDRDAIVSDATHRVYRRLSGKLTAPIAKVVWRAVWRAGADFVRSRREMYAVSDSALRHVCETDRHETSVAGVFAEVMAIAQRLLGPSDFALLQSRYQHGVSIQQLAVVNRSKRGTMSRRLREIVKRLQSAVVDI